MRREGPNPSRRLASASRSCVPTEAPRPHVKRPAQERRRAHVPIASPTVGPRGSRGRTPARADERRAPPAPDRPPCTMGGSCGRGRASARTAGCSMLDGADRMRERRRDRHHCSPTASATPASPGMGPASPEGVKHDASYGAHVPSSKHVNGGQPAGGLKIWTEAPGHEHRSPPAPPPSGSAQGGEGGLAPPQPASRAPMKPTASISAIQDIFMRAW